MNQETKRPLEDEKNSKRDKPTLKVEEKGENMLDSKKDGIYMVCDPQDSVNRFKRQESQKAHSKGT